VLFSCVEAVSVMNPLTWRTTAVFALGWISVYTEVKGQVVYGCGGRIRVR
jgi:hypothetical protein